jgi:hypothetical protein
LSSAVIREQIGVTIVISEQTTTWIHFSPCSPNAARALISFIALALT